MSGVLAAAVRGRGAVQHLNASISADLIRRVRAAPTPAALLSLVPDGDPTEWTPALQRLCYRALVRLDRPDEVDATSRHALDRLGQTLEREILAAPADSNLQLLWHQVTRTRIATARDATRRHRLATPGGAEAVLPAAIALSVQRALSAAQHWLARAPTHMTAGDDTLSWLRQLVD